MLISPKDDSDDLDTLLTILRKHDVTLYKDGEFVVQLAPKIPEFNEPETSRDVQAGGWKRGADLEQ